MSIADLLPCNRQCFSTHSARSKQPLNIIRLDIQRSTILNQLRIEEALLRASDANYLIINKIPPNERAIVLGISGHAERWAQLHHCAKDSIPLIQRFTGGGTVYLDRNTLMVTVIMNKSATDVKPFPRELMGWSSVIYRKSFEFIDSTTPKHASKQQIAPLFALRGHDYCLLDKKFGGNAQAITRDRLLHHSSLLMDYDINAINHYLLMPSLDRQPEYRKQRSHADFLTPLSNYADETEFCFALETALSEEFSHSCRINQDEVLPYLDRPHDKLLKVLDAERELQRVERQIAATAAQSLSST